MNAAVIHTARLRLEPLTRRHAAAFYALLQDERIYRFIPQEPPRSLQALEDRYGMLERGASSDGTQVWLNWVVRVRDGGEYVGQIQATVMADATALIAYELLPPHWGRGFALEACTWLVQELTRRGVGEVRAEVDTRNLASIRLLERLGFERVGFKVDADWFKGALSDEYTYRWLARGRA